ncbi:MAG: small multi-drug export protein [Acutalibacteraceae bacterium]|nr:small multi-drug export protein [Acutalibacteraceae bacterium]
MSFFSTYFGKIVMTFLISMVPVIELRGAIPIGVGAGLSPLVAIGVSIVGNLVPVPFIIIFIKKIFAWLRKVSQKLDGLVTRLEKRAEKKSETVQRYAFWGLFILVAIPLPGTGAWTGALVAAMLEMPLKKVLPAIVLGVLGAAVIVSFVTYGAGALLFS